jgi:hypothetical protein
MSIAQVKKRFSEFELYLGRDKEGLRRLKLLKDDVNVLRTDLASAIEAKELAESIKDAARERADVAEAANVELRLEAHRLTQRVASLMADIASATKPDEEDSDELDVTPDRFSREMKSTLKSLMRGNDMPRCPKFSGSYKREDGNQCYAILRKDIAQGWSRRSLYLIGAVVALLVDFNGEVKIRSYGDTEEDIEGRVKDQTLIRHMLNWMSHNIDWQPVEKPGSGIYTDHLQ